MHRTITPESSPLGSRGPKSSSILQGLYSPERSSPLSPLINLTSPQEQLSNPSSGLRGHGQFQSQIQIQQRQRRKQYKSQVSSRISHGGDGSGKFDDSPAQQLLRHQFKAHCLERARRERRTSAVKMARRSSESDHPFSSDGFESNGMDMDVETDEESGADGENAVFEDELYKRVMLNEIRKARHAVNVSFERDFGSSVDPDMYEDMNALEEEFTGQRPDTEDEDLPLSDIEYDDALIAEYLAELEESELEAMQERVACGMVDIDTEDPSDLERQFAPQTATYGEQPSPTRSMYSGFAMSSPPTSPASNAHRHVIGDADGNVFNSYPCPFCDSRTRLYNHVACSDCITTRSLHHAQAAWADLEAHTPLLDGSHAPLVAVTPTGSGVGAMMFCSCEGCDWCFAL